MERQITDRISDLEEFRRRIVREEFGDKDPKEFGVVWQRPTFRERLFDRVRESLRLYILPAVAGALVGTVFILGMKSLVEWPDLKLNFNSVSAGVLTGVMVGVWLKYESRRSMRPFLSS